MATTTIHSLKYQIIADTGKFTKAIVATRDELKLQKKLLQDIRTPAQNYGSALDRLRSMQERGLLTMNQYRASVRRLKGEYDAAHKSASRLGSALGGRLMGIGAGLVGGVSATQIARSIIDTTNQIDEMAALAARSQIDIVQFQRLVHSMAFSTNASMEDVAAALSKMTVNIGKAQQGNKKLAETFANLNINLTALTKLDAAKQFTTIIDAMAKLPTETQKAAVAVELFGKGSQSILDAIRNGSAELERQLKMVDESGVVLSEMEVERAMKAADALDSMALSARRIKQDLAIAFSEPFQEWADGVSALSQGVLPNVPYLEQRAKMRANADFNRRTRERYMQMRGELTGNTGPLSDQESQRIFGGQSMSLADPVQARIHAEEMLKQLKRVGDATEQANDLKRQELSTRSER